MHKKMILKNGGLMPTIRMSKLKFNHPKMLALLLLMAAAGIFISNPGLCGTTVAEEIISLDLTEQPLGEVLDDIATETGYQFNFDESWEKFPISASINNESLHKALKRILGKLNNVIIYSSNRTIKIIIFDEATTSINRSNAFGDRASEDESVQRSYVFPAASLPPSPPASQEPPDVEIDSPPSDESDATASEPDDAAPEDEKPTENETGEAAAEATGPDGPEQNEDTPGPDEKSPDESQTDN